MELGAERRSDVRGLRQRAAIEKSRLHRQRRDDRAQSFCATPTVSGNVTDAKTGKPIERFEVLRVDVFSSGRTCVERGVYCSESRRVIGTTATIALNWRERTSTTCCSSKPTVTAAQISRRHLLKDGVTTVDFQLEPAVPIKGRVLDAKGARRCAAQSLHGDGYSDLRVPRWRRQPCGPDKQSTGEYSLPAPHGKFALFAEHANGFVQKEFAKDSSGGDLTLQPWAKVSGRLLQDGKPISNQYVLLQPLQRTQNSELQPEIRLYQVSPTLMVDSNSHKCRPA